MRRTERISIPEAIERTCDDKLVQQALEDYVTRIACDEPGIEDLMAVIQSRFEHHECQEVEVEEEEFHGDDAA